MKKRKRGEETGVDEVEIVLKDGDELLMTEKEVEERYGIKVRCLRNWRHRGGGPRFVRFSPRMVRYRPVDVMEHIEARLARNTADTTDAERESEKG